MIVSEVTAEPCTTPVCDAKPNGSGVVSGGSTAVVLLKLPATPPIVSVVVTVVLGMFEAV